MRLYACHLPKLLCVITRSSVHTEAPREADGQGDKRVRRRRQGEPVVYQRSRLANC